MSEPDQPPTPERLTALLQEANHDEVVACLDRLGAAAAETRKRALRAVRNSIEDYPTGLEELATPLAAFLTDDDRAVRLTTAKLFVALAQSEPATVLPAVDALADRLADDEEFYYVRARCAEALGYVAVDSPEEVTDPETLADLRIDWRSTNPKSKRNSRSRWRTSHSAIRTASVTRSTRWQTTSTTTTTSSGITSVRRWS